MAKNQKVRTGWILLAASLLVALAPVLLALVLIPLQCGGYSGANEGNCGPAALPWLMFLSVPAGIVTAIVGLVTLLIGFSKPPTAKQASRSPIVNTELDETKASE